MPTFGSLFAGIGGIDLGLERAGWTCRFQVEWDDFCQRVLAKHWPDIPRYGDITTVDWSGVERVDLLAGGFPCQPFSVAGKQRRLDDDRWLWPEFARAIRQLRPRYVLVENVPGLLAGAGMGDVLGDLAQLGYDAEWESIPAAAVGAPHLRYRVWIIAYRQGDSSRPDADGLGSHRAPVHLLRDAELRDEQDREPRPLGEAADAPHADCQGESEQPVDALTGSRKLVPYADGGQLRNESRGLRRQQSNGLEPERQGAPELGHDGAQEPLAAADGERGCGWPTGSEDAADAGEPPGREGRGWWDVEPDVGRVADGVPARVDRLRSLGNAVVPQVVEVIGRRLLEAVA